MGVIALQNLKHADLFKLENASKDFNVVAVNVQLEFFLLLKNLVCR